MRVMLVSDVFVPQVNGISTAVQNLARVLTERGHRVLVYTVRTKMAGDDAVSVTRVRNMPIPRTPELGIAGPLDPTIFSTTRSFRPHIIHCHTPFGVGWQGLFAGYVGNIPLIGTYHSHPDMLSEYINDVSIYGQVLRRIVNRGLRFTVASYYNLCDVRSCASSFLSIEMAKSGVRERILTVPNFVNSVLFHPLPTQATGEMGHRLNLVWFGRLAREKHLYRLIEVIKPVLLNDDANVNLQLIGDGPERTHLEKFVRLHGLNERISFKGLLRNAELSRVVASCDICVSITSADNQPMSLLESMACGVPVVAISTDGVREIIRDGYNGFLVESDCDLQANFVHCLQRLIADRELRQAMGLNARAWVEQHNNRCMQLTLGAYRETIRQARMRIRK